MNTKTSVVLTALGLLTISSSCIDFTAAEQQYCSKTSGSCHETDEQIQDSGVSGVVGLACDTDVDCAGLLSGSCRHETSGDSQLGIGPASYQAGFCTRRCNDHGGNSCPTGSICMAPPPGLGGEEPICVPGCTKNEDCRSDGYSCYELDSGVAVSGCWITPLPRPPPPPRGLLGSPCQSNYDCQDFGRYPLGVCHTEVDGGSIPWNPGGYCSTWGCLDSAMCGNDGVCFTDPDPRHSVCVEKCRTPDYTRGDPLDGGCRSGYQCIPLEAGGPVASDSDMDAGFCVSCQVPPCE